MDDFILHIALHSRPDKHNHDPVFGEMTEKNAHFTVSYGYRPGGLYATSSSSGKVDYMRLPCHKKKAIGNGRGRQE